MRTMMWRGAAGVLLAVIGFATAGAPGVSAQAVIPVRAAISGEVLPLQLAQVGQAVKQGDTLLFVRSATAGAVPAARSPADGLVTQMLVRPGDHVNIGDVVAAVQPQ